MRIPLRLGPAILGALLLMACAVPFRAARDTGTPQAPSAQGVATAPSGASATAASADADVQAIKTVIQRANEEQARALASHDPTIMRDTATSEYYDELVAIQRQLEAGGVTAIKLVNLEWGPVNVQGATAQATTYETWQTTFADGSTEQERDRNVYTLVQQAGSWKIQADAHPDSALDQASGGAPGSTVPAPGTAPTVPGRPQPNGVTGTEQSSNWSGYVATGGTFTAVSGTWTVPQVSGTQPGAGDATWVGIGGERSRDLIQAGTDATVLGAGRVRYSAWIETLPQAAQTVPLTVSPGDTVTVSLTQREDGVWAITFENHMTGQRYQTTVRYSSSLSSAEWIEEAPSGGRRTLPLDDFGTVQFRNATTVKDGREMTAAQAGARPIAMVDRSGQVLARPSPIDGDGAGFSVTRLPTAPAAAPRLRYAR
jgi:hypothetical protein